MSLHQERTHPEFVEGCFGCKISTLELAPGDARKQIAQKKWDGELAAYRAARCFGVKARIIGGALDAKATVLLIRLMNLEVMETLDTKKNPGGKPGFSFLRKRKRHALLEGSASRHNIVTSFWIYQPQKARWP